MPDGTSLILGLLLVGFLLLVAEVFLPGYIAGIMGVFCLAISVGAVFYHYGSWYGSVATLAVGGVTVAGLVVWLNIFPKTFVGRRLILTSQQPHEIPPGAELIGKEGTALTPLRPTGAARIAGKRVDVTAIGEFLKEGTPLLVVAADGLRVAVRQKDGLVPPAPPG